MVAEQRRYKLSGPGSQKGGCRAEHAAHILIFSRFALAGRRWAQNLLSEALAVYNRRIAVTKYTGMICIRVLCVRVVFYLVNVHKFEFSRSKSVS